MRIVWSLEAESDLEGAFDYIAQDSPQAALDIFYRVKEQVERLAEQPGIGRPGRVPGTKELVVNKTPFVVPYRVLEKKKCVEIIRVFHSSREWPDRF